MNKKKNGKGQMPFPADKALNGADKVKIGLYYNRKSWVHNKRKKEAILLLPQTQAILSWLPCKVPNPQKMISKSSCASE